MKIRQFIVLSFLLSVLIFNETYAQGVNIPAKTWGLSFGNSPNFTGFRFNYRDRDFEKANIFYLTIWEPYTKFNEGSVDGVVNGLAVGLPIVRTGTINGIAVGIGMSADNDMNGINMGVLGAGTGDDMNGINIGGLGIGSGGNLKGFNSQL